MFLSNKIGEEEGGSGSTWKRGWWGIEKGGKGSETEMNQTMYTHMNICINNKKRKKELDHMLIEVEKSRPADTDAACSNPSPSLETGEAQCPSSKTARRKEFFLTQTVIQAFNGFYYDRSDLGI
jgi:hypothetical protein